LAAPPDSIVPATTENQALQAALRTRGVLVTDLHSHGEVAAAEQPRIGLSFWVPLGVKPGTGASAMGALLIEIDPRQFLYPLIQSWPTPSRTAETLLIRREGGEVVYLNTLRHRANTELSFRLPVDRRSLPAAMAVTGKEGMVEGEDYRHVPVLAAVRGVPGTPWFIVAKEDRNEIFAPFRQRVWMIVGILLVSVLAAVLGMGLLWRRREAQVLREQQVADRRLNVELEQRVKDRTGQLEASNRELEAFCYSVSHDLRAPLRGIDGWSLALLEDYHDKLDEEGHRHLRRVRADTQRMGRLIDALLLLSRVTRGQIQRGPVDLTALARSVAARFQEAEPERRVEFSAQPGLTAQGDARLLEIVLSNLLGNAWKFTGGRPLARVEFGRTEIDSRPAFFVRDSGVGFDMNYAQKLFGAFQRMHRASEFPGTGIGLATVQRIIQRYGGRVWAEAQVDRGATFYFTLDEAA
jgi:signal transduction histidine kinase